MWKSNISRGWSGAVRGFAPVAVIVLILSACSAAYSD
jgi:hypothetical protein